MLGGVSWSSFKPFPGDAMHSQGQDSLTAVSSRETRGTLYGPGLSFAGLRAACTCM